MEPIELHADDGTRLAANHYPGGEHALILLHQRGLDKRSWHAFALKAQERGMSAIAVDLRGHGESDGSLEELGEEDYLAMLSDAEAAAQTARERGARRLSILGASIGANTALRFAQAHPETAHIVALSPGMNYKGITLEDVMVEVPLLIVVGKGDAYSASSAQSINESHAAGEHRLLIFESEAHGTHLLAEHDGLATLLLDWLEI